MKPFKVWILNFCTFDMLSCAKVKYMNFCRFLYVKCKSLGIVNFLLALILSLPLAQAEMLSVEKISGVDNANGFIKQNDILAIDAIISMPADSTIERDQLRVYFDSSQEYLNFESCNRLSSGTLCSFRKNLYGMSGSHNFDIALYSDAAKADPNAVANEKATRVVSVDIVAPSIKEFDIEPKIAGSGNLILSYRIEDYSENSDNTLCSGLKMIEIAKNDFGGEELAAIEGNGMCEQAGSYVLNGVSEGKFDICAFAIDNMGQISRGACKEVIVDKTAPAVQEINFYKDGERLTHIGRQASTLVDVGIVFDELLLERVTADFSNLARGSLKNAESVVEGNQAVFSSVPVGGFSQCRFGLRAEDKLANVFSGDVGCRVGFDEIGPEVVAFASSRQDKLGNNLVGGEAKLTVSLREADSGLHRKQVFLGLGAIGMGSRVQATDCEQNDNIWVCSWDVAASKGAGRQQLSISGSDDTGNPVISQTFEVIVDLTKPTVEFVGVKAINEPAKKVFIANDLLEFEFNINDFGNAYADLSELGYEGNISPDYCVADGINITATKCYWRPIEVLFSEAGRVQLPFYFWDSAGNKATKTVSLELLEKLDAAAPDYWRVANVECSPNPVDRQAASLVPQGYKVVCRISLAAKKNGIRATHISFSPDRCEGDFNGRVLGITASNTGVGRLANEKDFYLSITLANSDFLIPNFRFECPFSVSTRIGRKYVTAPEEEHAIVTLSFFDNPMGLAVENYDHKIKNAKESAQKIWKVTSNFETFFERAKQVCQAKTIISSVLGAFDGIIALFGGTGEALEKVPVTAPAGSALKTTSAAVCYGPKSVLEDSYIGPVTKAVSGATNVEGVNLYDTLEAFCSYINCNLEGNKAPNGAYFSHMGERILSLKTLGGGAPWCTDAIDWLNKEVLGEIKLEGAAQIDPKESLVLSIGCLCLAGIIRNLNKLAEVKCKYALCMKNKVKEAGFPATVCEQEEAYDECMFVYGEIFNAIPIVAVLSNMFNRYTEMLANWPGLIFALVGGALCTQALCHTWWAYYGCIAVKTLNKISDAVVSIKSVANKDYWQVETGYCKELLG